MKVGDWLDADQARQRVFPEILFLSFPSKCNTPTRNQQFWPEDEDSLGRQFAS